MSWNPQAQLFRVYAVQATSARNMNGWRTTGIETFATFAEAEKKYLELAADRRSKKVYLQEAVNAATWSQDDKWKTLKQGKA